MAKRRERLPFDKRGGVLVMRADMFKSNAWQSLSPASTKLMPLLQIHWRNDKPVAYGVREAMQKVGCAKGTAMKAFKELEAAGFIVKVDESIFNSRTLSKARTWRLTWLPYQGRLPTNDWEISGKPGQNSTLDTS